MKFVSCFILVCTGLILSHLILSKKHQNFKLKHKIKHSQQPEFPSASEDSISIQERYDPTQLDVNLQSKSSNMNSIESPQIVMNNESPLVENKMNNIDISPSLRETSKMNMEVKSNNINNMNFGKTSIDLKKETDKHEENNILKRKSETAFNSGEEEIKDEKLIKLKKEEELLENEIKLKEKLLKEKIEKEKIYLSEYSTANNHNSQANESNVYLNTNIQSESYQNYLQSIPQTFHYQSYYPYYHYYWYYCDDYRTQYSQYFNYYSHNHPTIQSFNFGPLVLGSGQILNLHNSSHNFNYIKASNSLRECKNGPKYYFTVKVNNKVFRVFLGDVNDFFNIQCLYMMSSVISIGQINHAQKLVNIYDNPNKRITYKNDRLSFNPFESSELIPSEPFTKTVSKNVEILSFSLENSSLPRKSLVFYHKRDLMMTRSEEIFRELSHYSNSGNVLFIVDHLQRSSVQVFRHFLVKYRRFSPRSIHRIRYKRFKLFPRNFH